MKKKLKTSKVMTVYPPAHKRAIHWQCPICNDRLIIHSLLTLHCNVCNEYYTVTQEGDLEKMEMP